MKALSVCIVFLLTSHLYGASLEGKIVDQMTGAGIGGAQVFIWNTDLSATTDANGHYSIQLGGISSGYYVVIFDAVNYRPMYVDSLFLEPEVGISSPEDHPSIPETYMLYQNYPNPFNPVTTIKYGLPEKSFLTINVYNITGQLVRTLVKEEKEAGYHILKFDGKDLPSGIYLIRFQTGSFAHTKKAIILK